MEQQRPMTNEQIQDVFQTLKLSGGSQPPTLAPAPTPPAPAGPPVYFPLSADSLAVKTAE
jgi:hypothetical protein